MNEVIYKRMYLLIGLDPRSAEVVQFEMELEGDPLLRSTWKDFLIEQHLADELDKQWTDYLYGQPQIGEEIVLQRAVHDSIRQLARESLRTTLKTKLPGRQVQDVPNVMKRRKRLNVMLAAAAIGMLCIGFVLWNVYAVNRAGTEAELATLMIEPFELEGVTEDMIVRSIAQRLPMKLAAAEGIYPVTYYAVDHAMRRSDGDRQLHEMVGATYVVRGKVHKVGQELSIEAALFDLTKNRRLWREVFTSAGDTRALQDLNYRISTGIAGALHGDVSDRASERMQMAISDDPLAVSLFLNGERLWSERTEQSLLEAIRFLEMAVERDRLSPMIRGYLALACATYAANDYGGREYWERALSEANKVMERDPSNPEAVLVRGEYAYHVEKDYRMAVRYFTDALHEHPGDARVHQALAELYLRTGDLDVGIHHLRIARYTEPEHRVVRWVETKYLTATQRLEDARLATEDLIALHPEYLPSQSFFWQYHLSRGEHELALLSIPAHRPVSVRNYMAGMVYLDLRDFDALHALYPAETPESFVLLEYIQKDDWDNAYAFLRTLLEERRFGLLAHLQTADFPMFRKIRTNEEIVRILAGYGIRLNRMQMDEPVM